MNRGPQSKSNYEEKALALKDLLEIKSIFDRKNLDYIKAVHEITSEANGPQSQENKKIYLNACLEKLLDMNPFFRESIESSRKMLYGEMGATDLSRTIKAQSNALLCLVANLAIKKTYEFILKFAKDMGKNPEPEPSTCLVVTRILDTLKDNKEATSEILYLLQELNNTNQLIFKFNVSRYAKDYDALDYLKTVDKNKIKPQPTPSKTSEALEKIHSKQQSFAPQYRTPQKVIPKKGPELYTEIKPGLFVGEAKTKENETIYLGFERLDSHEKIKFWSEYNEGSLYAIEDIGKLFKTLCAHIKNKDLPTYPSGISEVFENKKAYEEAIVRIKKDGPDNIVKRIESTGPGRSGFMNVGQATSVNFVAYASRVPIVDYHSISSGTSLKTTLNGRLKEYLKHYKNIIMSYGAHTKENSPSFTHAGIFRNECGFLFEAKYSNISDALHGFGAAVEKGVFGASIMVNRPTPPMRDMLVKALGNEKVCIKSRDDGGKFDQALKTFVHGHSQPVLPSDQYDHKPEGFNSLVMVTLDDLEKLYVNPDPQTSEKVVTQKGGQNVAEKMKAFGMPAEPPNTVGTKKGAPTRKK